MKQTSRTAPTAEVQQGKSGRSAWGGMLLITSEIMKTLPPLADFEDASVTPTTMLRARFFCPLNAATWYVVAGSADTAKTSVYDDDIICCGFVTVDGKSFEWGMISIRELESTALPLRMHIERDLYFDPCALKDEPRLASVCTSIEPSTRKAPRRGATRKSGARA